MRQPEEPGGLSMQSWLNLKCPSVIQWANSATQRLELILQPQSATMWPKRFLALCYSEIRQWWWMDHHISRMCSRSVCDFFPLHPFIKMELCRSVFITLIQHPRRYMSSVSVLLCLERKPIWNAITKCQPWAYIFQSLIVTFLRKNYI